MGDMVNRCFWDQLAAQLTLSIKLALSASNCIYISNVRQPQNNVAYYT